MDERLEWRLVTGFIWLYVLVSLLLSILQGGYEFLFYAVVTTSVMLIAIYYHKKLHLSIAVMVGLLIHVLLHLLGGAVRIAGTRLYDFWLIPGIFRWDNLVHSFGMAVITIIIYSLLRPHLDTKVRHNKFLLGLLLVMIVMGLGAVWEIFELIAVLVLNAGKEVGGYLNNAFDLVFNMLGSIISCFFVLRYHQKSFHKEQALRDKKNQKARLAKKS